MLRGRRPQGPQAVTQVLVLAVAIVLAVTGRVRKSGASKNPKHQTNEYRVFHRTLHIRWLTPQAFEHSKQPVPALFGSFRSEERRVGKEGRCRWSTYD